MTPRPIALILESSAIWFISRVLITFMFWWEGLYFLTNFSATIPILNVLGVQPAWLMPAITLLVMFAGSILVLLDRHLWLGAGLLGGFTFLTIPLVHHFWTMTGQEAYQNRLESEEHLAVIGGLIALSMASHLRSKARGGA